MLDVLEAWAAAPATSTRVPLAALGRKESRGEFREPLVPRFQLPIPQFLLLETSLKLQPASSFQNKIRLGNEIVTPTKHTQMHGY